MRKLHYEYSTYCKCPFTHSVVILTVSWLVNHIVVWSYTCHLLVKSQGLLRQKSYCCRAGLFFFFYCCESHSVQPKFSVMTCVFVRLLLQMLLCSKHPNNVIVKKLESYSCCCRFLKSKMETGTEITAWGSDFDKLSPVNELFTCCVLPHHKGMSYLATHLIAPNCLYFREREKVTFTSFNFKMHMQSFCPAVSRPLWSDSLHLGS